MQPAFNLFETYQQADALLSDGQLQQSADLCKTILDIDPQFAPAYHLMSGLFKATGNFEKALNFSTTAVRLSPQIADFHMRMGQVLFMLGKWPEASLAFQKAHELQPANVLALLLWADSAGRAGESEKAEMLFAQARKQSDAPDVDEHEGLWRFEQGECARAEALFNRVIEKKPAYEWSYVHKGKLLLACERNQDAEAAFGKALFYNGRNAEALMGMAVASERLGQIDTALSFAGQAVEVRPSLDSIGLLAGMALRCGDAPLAYNVFGKALEVAPDHFYSVYGMVLAAAELGRMPEALAYVQSRVRANPRHKMLAHFERVLRGDAVRAHPEGYIATLLDEQAMRLDAAPLEKMLFTPQAFAGLVREVPVLRGRKDCSFLDLGCGKGDVCAALGEAAGVSAGVDCAPRMLRLAQMNGRYGETHALDAVEFATGCDRTFDLIAAYDAFNYIGDLSVPVRAIRNVMGKDSILVFALETEGAGSEPSLQPGGRFRHGPDAVKQMLSGESMEIVSEQSIVWRMSREVPVGGVFFAVRKRPLH